MKKILLTLGIALAALVTTQANAQDCSGNRYKQVIFTDIDSVMNVKYGSNFKQDGVTNEDLYMDVYFPKNDADNSRAVILLAHGGSFIGGDKADVAAMCKYMASMGYVAITINYRLLAVDASVFTNLGPAFKQAVVRAIHDMRASIRYVRNSADNGNPYGINPDLIITGGVSAGAIMTNHVTYLDKDSEVPTDLMAYMTAQGGLEGNSGTPGVSSVPQMNLSMCGAVMDTTWINAGDQPYYGIHTTDDDIVPYLYGQPNVMGMTIPVDLYGDSLIFIRSNGQGVSAKYKNYLTGGHCGFLQNPTQLSETMDDMMGFTYHNLCETGLLNTNNIADKLYFSAYPNPTSSDLTIEIPSNQWESTIAIVDLLGKTVFTATIPATQSIYNVNVSTMPAGIYQVRVQTNDGRMAIQKIVVE